MITVLIYYPCQNCNGTGITSKNQSESTSNLVQNQLCLICNGTGKGKIKEIREEIK